MVEFSAHIMSFRPAANRASRHSFAYGLVFATPASVALWGAILWTAAHVV